MRATSYKRTMSILLIQLILFSSHMVYGGNVVIEPSGEQKLVLRVADRDMQTVGDAPQLVLQAVIYNIDGDSGALRLGFDPEVLQLSNMATNEVLQSRLCYSFERELEPFVNMQHELDNSRGIALFQYYGMGNSEGIIDTGTILTGGGRTLFKISFRVINPQELSNQSVWLKAENAFPVTGISINAGFRLDSELDKFWIEDIRAAYIDILWEEQMHQSTPEPPTPPPATPTPSTPEPTIAPPETPIPTVTAPPTSSPTPTILPTAVPTPTTSSTALPTSQPTMPPQGGSSGEGGSSGGGSGGASSPSGGNMGGNTPSDVGGEPSDYALPQDNPFADVGDGWEREGVLKVYTMGIMQGYEDGSFRPWESITRAELAVIICRIMEYNKVPGNSFFDCESHWAVGYIEAVAGQGIMKGYGQGEFRPDAAVNREEFVTVLGRMGGYAETEGRSHFSDGDTISDWAVGYVGAAYERGIVKGYEDGGFRPQTFASRAEVAAILSRIYTIAH